MLALPCSCSVILAVAASGAMAGIRRMFVGLKPHESSDIVPAKFVDCIVNLFNPDELRVRVSCELKDDMLVLSRAKSDGSEVQSSISESSLANSDMSSVILQHSPECPVLRLGNDEACQLSEKVRDRGVNVAVAVILESLDHKILLTQRADHMRSFPRVWVPPGGHLEYGENFVEGAFRELEEETGLKFNLREPQVQLLCLWESVFPVLLGFGVPKNHHIVAYYHLHAQESWKQLQEKIKLDPEEVQACTWLDEQNVQSMFERKKSDLNIADKFCLEPDGTMKHVELDLTSMFHPSLWQEKKIYSGTQLALHSWLSLRQSRLSTFNSKM